MAVEVFKVFVVVFVALAEESMGAVVVVPVVWVGEVDKVLFSTVVEDVPVGTVLVSIALGVSV